MATTTGALARTFLGAPLRSDRLDETLLPKRLALPVFCSDPLSSVAYATEQIVLVLGLGGLALLHLTSWVAAAVRVGAAGLPVGGDDHHQQDDDAEPDPRGQVQQREAAEAEDEDDLLGRVGHGGERVGAEHRKGELLGQQRVAEPVAAQGAPDEQSLGGVEHASTVGTRTAAPAWIDGFLMPRPAILTPS